MAIDLYGEYKARIVNAPSGDMISGELARHAAIINCEFPIIGMRTPAVRKLATSVPISRRGEVLDGYFADGERLFETTLFAGCVAVRKGDYAATRDYLKRIIPLFGSWAHVDTVIPGLRWTAAQDFVSDFSYLSESERQYEKRAYIIYLMTCCPGESGCAFALSELRRLTYGSYYVDMAAAWLVATALSEHYDMALNILTERALPPFVHNKAIQKARESFRIPKDVKAELLKLRVEQ